MGDGTTQMTVDRTLFRIDRDRLDEEWERQATNYYQVAEQLAAAITEEEAAKDRLEVVEATLYKQVRSDPAAYGLCDKPTEKAVNSEVLLHPKYRRAKDDLIRAEERKNLWKAATTAMDHKKSALERLVSLHGQQYFSQPKAPDAPAREVVEEAGRRKAFGKPKKRPVKV